ncbi:hypothetical protein ACFL54_01085 [Planctomycetota bacterium]
MVKKKYQPKKTVDLKPHCEAFIERLAGLGYRPDDNLLAFLEAL